MEAHGAEDMCPRPDSLYVAGLEFNPGPADSRVRALVFYTVLHVFSNYLLGACSVLDTILGAWTISGVKWAKKAPPAFMEL